MTDISFFQAFFLLTFGFFVGIVGSVMGVGGGVFIVPLLVLIFKLPIQNAIAISLVSIVAVSSAVASINVEKGLANIRLGTVMETTMALGSIFGSLVMSRLPSKTVSLFFSIFLFPTALSMYLKAARKSLKMNMQEKKNGLGGQFYDASSGRLISYQAQKLPQAMFFSFFGGGLSGMLGLGGGIVQVPVMNILCKVPIKAAAATSNFMIGVSAAASAIVFYRKGYIIPILTFYICLGVLLGSFLGMKVLNNAKSEKIQMLFSLLIFMVAIKMLLSSL